MLKVKNVFTIDIIAPQDEDIYNWVKNTLKPVLSRQFNLSVIGDGGLQSVSIDFECKPYPIGKNPAEILEMIRQATNPIIPFLWGVEWFHWTYEIGTD